ncbi:hypothetical protein OQA88_4313 [Cercophora sp. LCS_1]
MSSFGHKGLEAVQNRDWENAVTLLNKALIDSDSPAWLLARAQAHTNLKNYDDALHDIELAYNVAAERGSGTSRKHMIEAQYRRSVVYFRMGRFADADCCAKWSMLLAEGRPAREVDGVDKKVDESGRYTVTQKEGIDDKANQPGKDTDRSFRDVMGSGQKTGYEADWSRAYTWRSQALGRLEKLPLDDPGRIVSVTKIPSKPAKKVETKPAPVEIDSDEEEIKAIKQATQQPTEKPTQQVLEVEKRAVPRDKMKLRTDFYQTNQTVTISLFVKDVNKEHLKVEFSKNQVRISPIPREAASYVKSGDPEATSTLVLTGSIIPSGSRWTVTPRKIELVLQKETPGAKWSTWGEEKIGSVNFEVEVQTPASQAPKPVTTASKLAAPAYPTSSKSGPKDWDNLGDDEEDEKDVNYFFKQLYKGATPEQQRAMMKSFTESNGTTLSTDWDDVKNRTVETNPPEGVVAKKWDQ